MRYATIIGGVMKVRKFIVNDKPAVQRICAETATLTRYKENKDLVSLLYCDYYIDNEPKNCFVLADEDDCAVGYVICSIDRQKFESVFPNYLSKAKKLSYIDYLSLKTEERLMKKIYDTYPCHLHIDILPDYQHKGYGKLLIDTLLQHLKEQNVTHIRLTVGANNKNALAFYNRLGFVKLKNVFGLAYVLVKEI